MFNTFLLFYHPFFLHIPFSSTGADLSYDDEEHHYRVHDLGRFRLSNDSKHTNARVPLSTCFSLIWLCQIFHLPKLLHFQHLGQCGPLLAVFDSLLFFKLQPTFYEPPPDKFL